MTLCTPLALPTRSEHASRTGPSGFSFHPRRDESIRFRTTSLLKPLLWFHLVVLVTRHCNQSLNQRQAEKDQSPVLVARLLLIHLPAIVALLNSTPCLNHDALDNSVTLANFDEIIPTGHQMPRPTNPFGKGSRLKDLRPRKFFPHLVS